MKKIVFILWITLIIVSCTDHSTMVEVEGNSSSSVIKLSSSIYSSSSSLTVQSSASVTSSSSVISFSSAVSLSSSSESSISAISSSSSMIFSSSEQSSSSFVIQSSSSRTPISSSMISSSSLCVSSSSLFQSSSSKAVWAYLNAAISYGEIVDSRDDQVYKTVLIGTQTWMAENLNYDTLDGTGSWCYDNTNSYCDTYGRLYNWATVMGMPSTYNNSVTIGDSVNHRGICPEGWHVPRSSEWATLEESIGGADSAGTYLKTVNGWKSYEKISNLDSYGFSALPGGIYYYGSDSQYVGALGIWWTATEYTSSDAHSRNMDYFRKYVYMSYYHNKADGFSLRCLRN